MTFIKFRDKVNQRLEQLSQGFLYKTSVSGDDLYQHYLNSFPEGTNPIYRERTEHDCSCCKNFIRNIGAVLAIVDGEIQSIWDIEMEGYYGEVAKAMSGYVKSFPIENIYLNDQPIVGGKQNVGLIDSVVKTWSHFYYKLPNKFVCNNIATVKGENLTNKDLLERSLTGISSEAVEIVLDLINQNSLYRGEEHKPTVVRLKEVISEYITAANKELFLWEKSQELRFEGRFKNTVIGTLLMDISEGVDLEVSVKKFEAKVAPENYKRPTALITQGMVKKAQETIDSLGLETAIPRRFAVTGDLTINNVLFADRSAKKSMGVLDVLSSEVKTSKPDLNKVQEVGVKDFMENILPRAESLELLIENKHESNFVSLVAPVDKDSTNMLKWGNNFSWSYNGEVADSMKDRVKAKGGAVEGDLRFSIQWNDSGEDQQDLDAHCQEPAGGTHIYYAEKGRRQRSSGMLDVDIIRPGGKIAVENIIYTDKSKMPKGTYNLYVKNYSGGRTEGFSAEVECNGSVHTFNHHKHFTGDVKVAEVHWDGDTFQVNGALDSNTTPKTFWGVTTNKWVKVDMVMNSPNHWDGEETGNKHWFFILDGCKNTYPARGFYNEFLDGKLTQHRKVFEVLASKMKTQVSDDQLSGVGFSSTQSNTLVCKVGGSFNRVVKIKF